MRNKVYTAVVGLLFIIVFDVIFFLGGGESHGMAEWVSFAFVWVAYACLLVVPLLSPKSPSTAVTTGSTAVLGMVYFVAELVAASVFMLLFKDEWVAALIVQLILLALYAGAAVATLRANDATAQAEAVQEAERSAFSGRVDVARQALLVARDDESRRLIERVVDDLRSSPVASSSAAAPLDEAISQQLAALVAAAEDGNGEAVATLCESLRRTIAQRNQVL
ncbi:MAG: hypothetical protein HFJ75_02390 [Eggerthellaceae bacterium]|nr:hypothetical protein [Eggerthellaceae bacterium]